jgi:phospholipid/cholesterol/gamma-HCH transport system permease protein
MEPLLTDQSPSAAQMAELPARRPPQAKLVGQGAVRTLALTGDWIARRGDLPPDTVDRLLDSADLSNVAFDVSGIGEWDSALLAFLSDFHREARARNVAVDDAALPEPARRLLALMPREHAVPPKASPVRLRTRVGRKAIGAWGEMHQINAMLGDVILRTGAALRGRARMRWVDLLGSARDAGASALPIVLIVNVLMGGILAFVGAVQLRKFGAGVYVADLVGIAVVREIAALITAVVMSGRTGGAYAANIATMLGNEEIDALQAVGVPLTDYLILPRIAALTLMMPLLYLYGSVAGIFGGFLVATAMLDIGPIVFLNHVQYAVAGSQVVFGLCKSVAFGILIAITGCRIGLRAGRSAADVGSAATRAVVAGIVGVIALDAVFAVCANALHF